MNDHPDVLKHVESEIEKAIHFKRECTVFPRGLMALSDELTRLREIAAAADKLANIVLEQTSGYSCGPGKAAADAAREVKALAGEEKSRRN